MKKIREIIDENKRRNELNNILYVATELISTGAEFDTNPIFLLIKELCDIEYGRSIYSSISTLNTNKVPNISVTNLLPMEERKYGEYLFNSDFHEVITRSKYIEKSKVTHKEIINLGCDPVIAWPWSYSRLIGCIDIIKGEWIKDSNHIASLWLPYGVTYVERGNHSITTGCLQNRGSLNIDDIYHFSDIHYYIYTDGVYYFRREDDSIYAKVNNFNFATIFAIGNIIQKSRGVKFHGKNINSII